MYIDEFPVVAGALQGVSHVDIGPGGACNVAIMAARFGLPVASLGEIGADYFGQIVVNGLEKEGIRIDHIFLNKDGATPVAGVLVDPESDPGYLGYPGRQLLQALPQDWKILLQESQAVFADGWIEYRDMAGIILNALHVARQGRAKTFFDPGPGNPRQNNNWHLAAAELSSVVMATETEIMGLTGQNGKEKGAEFLLSNGSELIVVKRGAAGCVIYTKDDVFDVPGLPLDPVDATGAGDSLAGAVIYGCLQNLTLEALGTLANATGGAKVLKIGTGHQVPTVLEIQALLERFNQKVAGWY